MTPDKVYLRWEKLINKAKGDLIIISGDFLTFGDEYMDRFIKFLHTIYATDGILLSTGNHESFTNLNMLLNKLNDTKFIILDNKIHVINKNNDKLYISAISGIVDNLNRNIADFNNIIDRYKICPDILISHEGAIFEHAAHRGVKLCLSGHTHGGQLSMPFFPRINLAALRYRYSSGYYNYNNSHLNISKGLGIINLPMRLCVSPEISVIYLESNNDIKSY
jgi:predicted MPP superfamily phosphohydrolase